MEKTQMWKTLLPLLKMKKKGQHLLFVVFLMIAILLGMRSISLWLWFAFPQQWVMLNIFSCACWPSVCLLWNNFFRSSVHFLMGFFLFFSPWCWVVLVLCVFWILTSYRMYHLPLSSLIQILSDSPSKPCSWRE